MSGQIPDDVKAAVAEVKRLKAEQTEQQATLDQTKVDRVRNEQIILNFLRTSNVDGLKISGMSFAPMRRLTVSAVNGTKAVAEAIKDHPVLSEMLNVNNKKLEAVVKDYLRSEDGGDWELTNEGRLPKELRDTCKVGEIYKLSVTKSRK